LDGKNVIFLTTDDTLDPGLMGIWVSRLDAGWQLYANLTGRMPSPLRQFEGKVTIAAVPAYDLTCGAGCGYIGATGIELAMFYDHNYPELRTHPKAMPHYVFYEMGRNYYTFGDRHSCFITGFAVFLRYVCMDALKCEDRDAQTRKVIEGVEPLFSASGLAFLDLFTTATGVGEKVSRIKDGSGKVIDPSDQPVCYASAMLRLRRENGGDGWVKRFFHELAACPKSNPGTQEGALNQGWSWLLCSSVAAQKDLSPVFAGDWKLPIAEDTRAALARIDWKKKGLTLKEVTETVTPVWKSLDPSPQTALAEGVPQLVPLPKMLTMGQGSLTLTKSSRILATSKEVEPPAKVLADEIFLTTGVRLATASGQGTPGDAVLQLDPSLKGEAYTLEVKDSATVTGGRYQSVASGTVTLMQLLRAANGALIVPVVKIVDEPAYPYRGALIDLARKYHSPGGIEQVIELCRLYKICYLHLHLTDALLEKLVRPLTVQVQGKFAGDENTFTEPLSLTLIPNRPGLTLKYTLDNSLPNERWQSYAGPITVDQTVHLRAGLFDDQGAPQGPLVGSWFRSRIPVKPNLATGKPVTVGPSPDRKDGWYARIAVDGRADDAGRHWASEGAAPQWLQVDLEKIRPIDFINVITYWDGSRYYQWNAKVSVNGQSWKKVLDFSDNKTPATAQGYSGKFPKTEARYVRINMLKNSANPFVHIVELIVDETK